MPTQPFSLSTNTTATVQSGGPRPGFFGDIFFNIQGSSNGSFASFGVADFDLAAITAAGMATDILDDVTLELTQSNAGFTSPGTYGVYFTPDSTVAFSSLTFQSGTGTATVDPDLTGLEFLGDFLFETTGDVGSGTLDTVDLALPQSVEDAIIAEINDGDDEPLRLVLVPEDATVSATYSGSSENFDGPGPVLNLTVDSEQGDGGGDNGGGGDDGGSADSFAVNDLGTAVNATYDNSGLDNREFFFNVTNGSSSFAEFSVADFDLSGVAPGFEATGIESLTFEVADTSSDVGFDRPGTFAFFFTPAVDFGLRTQGGIENQQGNDGPGQIDPIFSDLEPLGFGSYTPTNDPSQPELSFTLTLTDVAEQYIVDQINDADSNDTLRIVLAPAGGDDLNAPLAGRTNFDDLNGPEISFTVTGGTAEPVFTINEVDADQTSTDSAEFIELYDGGVGNASLDGLTVVLFNGNGDASYNAIDLDGLTTDENGFFVIGSSNVPNVDLVEFTTNGIQNGADAVALYEGDASDFPNGSSPTTENLLDAIVYDTSDDDDSGLLAGLGLTEQFNEDANGAGTTESNSRVPDGSGTFVAQAPTPGATNGGSDDPGDPGTVTDRLISEIQGSGAASTLQGDVVRVTAVVTADYQNSSQGDINGFFLQEEDSDSDDDGTTSEGIFVFEGGSQIDVQVGDRVEIVARVTEFEGETQLSNISSLTVLESDVLDEVEPGVIVYPLASVTTAPNSFGDTITVADYEAYEGMLVTIPEEMTVGDVFGLGRWNEVGLTSGGRVQNFTQTNAPDVAAYQQFQEDVATRGLVINDAFYGQQNRDPIFPNGGLNADTGNILRAGDTVSGLTGVIGFKEEPFAEFNYRLIPTETPEFVASNPRPEQAPEVGGSLQVAAFNVLNFFTTIDTNIGNFNGPNIAGPAGNLEPRGAESGSFFSTDNDGLTELQRQTEKLVAAITEIGADILGLVEIENEQDPSVATQTSPIAIEALVDAVNTALGSVVYDFVDTGPIEGIQGGAVEGDAIKVGFIYKVDTVVPTGDFAILDESVDPRFETANTQRPALAQTFTEIESGATFTAAVNHFKSKGSIATYDDDGDPSTPEVPDAAMGDGQANNANIRNNAAMALVDWLATDPTGSGDEDFMILGDLNAYFMEDAIQSILAGADDTPGTEDDFISLVGEEDYSFAFPIGLDTVPWVQTFGTLDYALVNQSLAEQVTGSDVWHINADEAAVLDYNLNFQPSNQFDTLFAPDAFRASDHDPILVGLDLVAPVVAATDMAETGYHDPIVIDVLANDEGEGLSVASVDTAGAEGSVEIAEDGTLAYAPEGRFAYLDRGESATDTFVYTVTNGSTTDTAAVTVTLTGPVDDFDTGTPFSFSQGTNGGANRFGFNGEAFFISGQGVRGRPEFDDVDPFLVEAARIFDGLVKETGIIDDQLLDDGAGPGRLRVNAQNEVVLSGRGMEGRYVVGFENADEAQTFSAFIQRFAQAIDANDVVATDAVDFRFDAGPARLFFDKTNHEFGLTLDGGQTQARFSTLEAFVEAGIEAAGGIQTRDGDFNAVRISEGGVPNQIRVDDDGDLIIAGRSVQGRFEFSFENAAAAETTAAALVTLFDEVDRANTVAFGDDLLV